MGRGKGIRTASASSIEIEFQYRGVRCREKIKLAPSKENLRFVDNLKGRIAHEIATNAFDYAAHFPRSRRARIFAKTPSGVVTVSELLTEWLASVHKTLEPETYLDYAKFIARLWKPQFGQLPINQLTLERVMTWINAQTTSKKRILNKLTPLRQAMKFAVIPKGLLPVDPLGKIAIKRSRGIDKNFIDPFEPAEVRAICAQLRPWEINLVQFWAWSGLREGEIFALTWDDIDEKRGVIHINKAMRRCRLKATKTEAGCREVKLLAPALEALARQKQYTRLMHGQIFLRIHPQRPSSLPGPWYQEALRRRWQNACRAAGVRYRFPRQLRHTYASWMFAGHEDPMWISRQMGHAHVGITLKTYTRYVHALNVNAGSSAVAAILADLPGDKY